MIREIFGSETRGRKKRIVTTLMIEDLTKLNKEDYCEKHKVGENFFLNLYYKNVGAVKEVEKVEEVIIKTEFSFQNMFEGIIPMVDRLIEVGYAKWLKEIEEKYKVSCYKESDICHKIEIRDTHSQVEKIVLFDMLREVRLERRAYKDGIDFAKTNQNNLIDFVTLVNSIKLRKNFLNERGYYVRVLKEEFGEELKKGENIEKN